MRHRGTSGAPCDVPPSRRLDADGVSTLEGTAVPCSRRLVLDLRRFDIATAEGILELARLIRALHRRGIPVELVTGGGAVERALLDGGLHLLATMSGRTPCAPGRGVPAPQREGHDPLVDVRLAFGGIAAELGALAL